LGYGLIASVLPISVFLFFYFFAKQVINLESIDAKILYIIWGFAAIFGGFMIWLFLQSIFGELIINLTNRGGNIEKGIKIFGWHSAIYLTGNGFWH
jgi:predicted permease